MATIKTEIWKPIVGFEGYEVSNRGRARSYKIIGRPNELSPSPTRILSPGQDTQGRYTVHLSNGGVSSVIRIAVLVAAAFIGPRPDDMLVCHNDGNCQNDEIENLRYDTPAGNAKDRIAHGTHYDGQNVSQALLTDKAAKEIRQRCSQGETRKALAVEFGVSGNVIYGIIAGRSYQSAGGPNYNECKRAQMKTKLDDNFYGILAAQIKEARTQAGLTQADISKELDCTPQAVSAIENGVNRPSVEQLDTIIEATGKPYRWFVKNSK